MGCIGSQLYVDFNSVYGGGGGGVEHSSVFAEAFTSVTQHWLYLHGDKTVQQKVASYT